MAECMKLTCPDCKVEMQKGEKGPWHCAQCGKYWWRVISGPAPPPLEIPHVKVETDG